MDISGFWKPQHEQTIWLSVRKWNFKVFPSLQGSPLSSLSFEFEGSSKTTPLANIEVTGCIEVLEDGMLPGMLSDHWQEVPKNVEGFGFMTSVDDVALPPSLGFTLYCQPAAMDWIYRAFMVAGSGGSCGVSLEIKIDCPNNSRQEVWKEQWLTEWWRVVSWRVHAGFQVRDRIF